MIELVGDRALREKVIDGGTKVKFEKFSQMTDSFKSQTNYLKLKRLALRLSRNKNLGYVFQYPPQDNTPLGFALKYFDIDSAANFGCFYHTTSDGFAFRNTDDALSDFLTSLYESSRGFFQTFFSFLLKEAYGYYDSNDMELIKDELLALGFVYDGQFLRTTSGNSALEIRCLLRWKKNSRK